MRVSAIFSWKAGEQQGSPQCFLDQFGAGLMEEVNGTTASQKSSFSGARRTGLDPGVPAAASGI